MKQFVKAFSKTVNFSNTFAKMFPHFSEAKPKEGLFVGPDIRELMSDADFLLTMTEVERETWIAFNSVVTKFLGGKTRTLPALLLLHLCYRSSKTWGA
jgi:hypothetical protein